MSLLGDEDRCHPIIGISTLTSSLSFVTIVLFWCYAFGATTLCTIMSSDALPHPLWSLDLCTICIKVCSCGGFQRCLVLNSTHDLVIFPSPSSLGKMCSQDGRASDSERANTHLSCSAMGIID